MTGNKDPDQQKAHPVVGKPKRQPRRAFRPRLILRALHRDLGYLAVGLTLVYALSGLAVNHIQDWDPNFTQTHKEYQLKAPWPSDPDLLAQHVLDKLGVEESPSDIYSAGPEQLEVSLSNTTLHINPKTGKVFEEGQSPRFLLRAANWLHLNRGKKAWTYVADAYAAALLALAGSGLFMIRGRKGLMGRGAWLAALGAAIPIAYVWLSGGP